MESLYLNGTNTTATTILSDLNNDADLKWKLASTTENGITLNIIERKLRFLAKLARIFFVSTEMHIYAIYLNQESYARNLRTL